jgi:hypothetical protein
MRAQPKIVASAGVGDLTFDEALSRCRFRSVCMPHAKAGGEVAINACVSCWGRQRR